MGTEGNIARMYWEAVALGLSDFVEIPARVQENPADIFNASINYAYGILYGLVQSSLLMVGLDPYMGILHTNRHQQPALAFDHIEPFRPWADRLIMELILTKAITQNNIALNQEGLYRLDLEARKLIIDTFFAKMEERSYLNGKRIKNKDHINYLSTQLVNKLKTFYKI